MHIHGRSIRCCISLFFITAILAACGGQAHYMPDPGEVKPIPRKVFTASDEARVKLEHDLRKQGVAVIGMGSRTLLSISAQQLFYDQSPRLTWVSYHLLNQTVSYLKQFRLVSVHVTAFASPYVSDEREHALTFARARAVSRYLYGQGIDARLVTAEGAGREKPITAAPKAGDASLNARVEIIFEDTIV